MAKRDGRQKESLPKAKRESRVKKVVVEVPVVAAVPEPLEPPPAEMKAIRPIPECFRCGVKGAGKLCPRCGVVLGHSGQGEANLCSKPVNPMVGW